MGWNIAQVGIVRVGNDRGRELLVYHKNNNLLSC